MTRPTTSDLSVTCEILFIITSEKSRYRTPTNVTLVGSYICRQE